MRILSIALLALLAVACNSGADKKEEAPKTDSTAVAGVPREELLKKIKEGNLALTNLYNPDSLRFICSGQTKMCEEYVNSYPTDPEAALILTYQAKAYRILGQPKAAVASYSRIIASYGEFDNMPEVLFLKGFVLDEDLNDDDAAEAAYHDLIQKYPNHKFAQDAKVLLSQLHMSDEELIKMFKEKEKKKV